MNDADLAADLRPSLEAIAGGELPTYRLDILQGDASSRRYYRLHFENERTQGPASLIVMRLPEDAFKSDEGGTNATSKELPFLEVSSLLEDRSIRVPKVYAKDVERRVIILEDLGDTTFEKHLRTLPESLWQSPYRQAVELLAMMHDRCADLPHESIVSQRAFDRELFTWELEHFAEWGLEALDVKLSTDEKQLLQADFDRLTKELLRLPKGFVHRDYQSKNLMRLEDGTLAVIDFQDALVGPRVYDLVALLCDSYVSLDADFQDSMIEHYAHLRDLSIDDIRREFWLVALQRKLKDTGRFVYIDQVRGNPRFLQWFSQSYVYVGRALAFAGGYQNLFNLLKSRVEGFPDSVPEPAAVSVE